MNIIAFGASSSVHSINKKLAIYVAGLIPNANTKILDMNDYEMPIYSIDLEKTSGIPEKAHAFIHDLEWADVIVISFAEHNGSYTVAFKNIFDWASRAKLKMFENKKLILLSTSNGAHGAKTILDIATHRMPRHGAELLGSYALPSYKENFDEAHGITNPEIKKHVEEILHRISQ
jgi:NAD(P)H-dependent FMN reductase